MFLFFINNFKNIKTKTTTCFKWH